MGAISIQPDFHQRADDDPHHLPEKAAAFDADDQLGQARPKLAGVNRAYRVLATVARAGKRCEIVLADEYFGGLAHRIAIQPLPAMPS